jgi:hypothetical protein
MEPRELMRQVSNALMKGATDITICICAEEMLVSRKENGKTVKMDKIYFTESARKRGEYLK